MGKRRAVLAVSGVKNSGKTTLITRLIPYFKKQGYCVAVIKHDGHDFEADVKGTDSFRHKEAGAYGTAVFSSHRVQIVKEQKDINEQELMDYFPEADIILLEGFKYSSYDKIEIVRGAVSKGPVCRPETVAAYVSDRKLNKTAAPVFGFDEITQLGSYLLAFLSLCPRSLSD